MISIIPGELRTKSRILSVTGTDTVYSIVPYHKGSAGILTASAVATFQTISQIITLLLPTRPLAFCPSDRRHRWAIPTNPSVSHKPTLASSSASKPPATAIGSRYDIVVCAGTHSAVRTTHVVGGDSIRPTEPGSRWLGATRGKNRGCTAGSLKRPEVIMRSSDAETSV